MGAERSAGDPSRLLVTGVSGYLGTALCRRLEHEPWCERVVGVDVRPPLYKLAKLQYRCVDVTDPVLRRVVAELRPHVVVHLAAIVDPIPDEELTRRVNVDGTANVLASAAAAEVPHVLVASSGSAYGAWPDNPDRLDESSPLRPHPTFRYANDKAQVERLCRRFCEQHPEVRLAVVRPCVVYGPLVHNYLSSLITGLPWVTGMRGFDPPLQFVHEDDVVEALLAIVRSGASGPFNLAPNDTIRMSEVLDLVARPKVRLPFWLLERVVAFSWRLQAPFLKVPPSALDFFRYPWVLDSSKVQRELGFRFRYSSRETVVAMLRAKGLG